MITLHGFSASNYYNITKYVLLYKQIPFREHLIYGGGEDWLDVSPVGKVSAITTEGGQYLSETAVICDYLEEVYPDKPLYPGDPVERARVRQIMKECNRRMRDTDIARAIEVDRRANEPEFHA